MKASQIKKLPYTIVYLVNGNYWEGKAETLEFKDGFLKVFPANDYYNYKHHYKKCNAELWNKDFITKIKLS